jgi:hypothetical protein
MQRLEVSGAVRPVYGSLGFKRLRQVGRDVYHPSPFRVEVKKEWSYVDRGRILL